MTPKTPVKGMTPAAKRFARKYQPVADAISRLDVAQADREAVATAVADAYDSMDRDAPDFRRDLFWLLAADPMVPCAGPNADDGAEACPHGREIRLRWHWSGNPDGTGRSEEWRPRRPTGVRCVTCGAEVFVPGYPKGEAA